MEFRILGPLEVYDATGNRLQPPAGRERALLVALLLRRGEVVSVDALIDALWGERAPSTAAKAVQGYVSHLRRLLGPEAGDVLVTQAPGYVLRVPAAQVDAARFERLAGDGQRALEDGDHESALARLESALSLWRGSALAEFAFEDFAQREIQRLSERRLEANEDRVDALLRLGRHGGLVSELEAQVTAHPLRERLRSQLMLALYRSGRSADALQVYKEGARLSRELGLDPTTELRNLERAILDQDPAIGAPARRPDSLAPATAEPAASPRPSRRGALIAGGVLAAVLAVASLAAIAIDRARDSPSAVTVVPPGVAVIDPKTNRVVASIETGSKPVTIVADDDAVWVGDARDGTVTRIDPKTRKVVKTIGIGAPAVDLAASGGNVWVATGGFGTVVQLDSELNVEVDTIELGSPEDPIVVPAASSVAAGKEGVWVGAYDGLVRIDPRLGELEKRVDLGGTPALQIAVGGGAVWATIITSRALRVEASSAQVTTEFYAGGSVFPIALDRRAVWVGGYAGQLSKVDPVTGSTLLTSNLGFAIDGIALEGNAVWVLGFESNALVRVDPSTGQPVARIPIGRGAVEVAAAQGLVWVTVQEPEP